MSAVEVLDFDGLVRKHVRIVPTFRCFQIATWAMLLLVLAVLAVIVLAVAADIIWFGANIINTRYYAIPEPPQLDFRFTRGVANDLLTGETLQPSRAGLLDANIAWSLAVFVALSLISFQFDRFSLAASVYLAGRSSFQLVKNTISAAAKWHGTFDTTLSPIVSNGWGMIFYGYLWAVVFLTLRQLYTLSTTERIILREGATSARFARASFLHAFGIPSNIRNATRRVRTALFAYLANVVGFGPVALFLFSVPLIFLLFYVAAGPFITGAYDPARNPIAANAPFSIVLYHVVLVALMLLALFLLIATFRVAGNAGLRMSRRFMRVSLEQAQATDQRRPVLFLRSFQDDAVALAPPPSGFAYKLFSYADRKKSLDELLLEEGTTFGPVVALGNPNDAVPPYGAARGYAKLSDWQKMVSDLMEAAVAIVICVDETPSLWWEIEHVSRNAYLTKTLVLLHPKYADQDGASEVIGKIERVFGLPIARAASDRGRVFGFWFDPTLGLRVGLASRFSRAHYLLMLRWFLRSRI
jgi:hypothetical protein